MRLSHIFVSFALVWVTADAFSWPWSKKKVKLPKTGVTASVQTTASNENVLRARPAQRPLPLQPLTINTDDDEEAAIDDPVRGAELEREFIERMRRENQEEINKRIADDAARLRDIYNEETVKWRQSTSQEVRPHTERRPSTTSSRDTKPSTSKSVTQPVRQTAQPVRQTAQPVRQTAQPVRQTAQPVKQTAQPVKQGGAKQTRWIKGCPKTAKGWTERDKYPLEDFYKLKCYKLPYSQPQLAHILCPRMVAYIQNRHNRQLRSLEDMVLKMVNEQISSGETMETTRQDLQRCKKSLTNLMYGDGRRAEIPQREYKEQ